jgi:hypothetical protein
VKSSLGVTISLLLLLLETHKPSAATLYVSTGNPNPTPPYATWATAAGNIQDAIDVASAGDEILVTNGTYAAGGRTAGTYILTNRVVIDKPVIVQSVNGPLSTIIQGYQLPGTATGTGAVRCVYLSSNAVLSGFTLTNGATLSMGDSSTDGGGAGVWCESASSVVTNCLITASSAMSGGGAYNGTIISCTLTANSAYQGGGGFLATLNNCLVLSNSAGSGGGASNCKLNNCTVALNSANGGQGGGEIFCTATNCIMYYNTAAEGANYFDSCIGCAPPDFCCITPFSDYGGQGNITNEPLFVSLSGGDFHLQPGSPCINAGNNTFASGPTDLDGHPRVSGGIVDMGAYEFQFAGPPFIGVQPVSQLQVPGSNVTFTVVARGAVPLSYQWQFNGSAIAHATDSALTLTGVTTNQAGLYSVTVTNTLGSVPSAQARLTLWPDGTSYVWPNSPTPTPPYLSWSTAAHAIQDAVDVGVPGLVVLVTNGTYAEGGRVVVGALTNRVVLDKPLTLRSVNGPLFTAIQGFQVPGAIGGTAAVRCVYLADGATLSGFTLTNGATSPSGLFIDQNGGGALGESTNAMITNCILAGNSASTGGGGVYQATLGHCTLIANRASSGGGADQAILINCTVAGNSAEGYGFGGGAASSQLYNCTLVDNSASWSGGGAYSSTLYCSLLTTNSAGYGGGAASSQLYNCTLAGNSGTSSVIGNVTPNAGGAAACSLINSVLYDNTAVYGGPNYDTSCSLTNCCTTPLPTSGVRNFTNAPLFINPANGDFRLQSNSPCINAGSNFFVATATDLDGNPRISGATVDSGVYEFQKPASVISYAWLLQYGLPTDGSADFIDTDGDGMNNWQEWRAGTDPTDPRSALRMLHAAPNAPGLLVSWQSVSGQTYFLERSASLTAQPAFQTLVTNLVGRAIVTFYSDTSALGPGPFFYRVGVYGP